MSLINTQIQPFKANAFHNGKFIEVSNESLKGKWSVLVFMPAAFTFNCPTEVEDAAENYAEFQKAGAEIYIDVPLDMPTLDALIHDNAIARDMKETLRKLKAAQYVASHPGQVCPAKWKEGEKTIAPSLDLVGKI